MIRQNLFCDKIEEELNACDFKKIAKVFIVLFIEPRSKYTCVAVWWFVVNSSYCVALVIYGGPGNIKIFGNIRA